MAQQVGGVPSRLVDQQLERWAEVGADRFYRPERIRLLSLVAGRPVQQGTNETVNTCAERDWERSLAAHLWYAHSPGGQHLGHPGQLEAAWQGPRRTLPGQSQPTERTYRELGGGGGRAAHSPWT